MARTGRSDVKIKGQPNKEPTNFTETRAKLTGKADRACMLPAQGDGDGAVLGEPKKKKNECALTGADNSKRPDKKKRF